MASEPLASCPMRDLSPADTILIAAVDSPAAAHTVPENGQEST